MKKIGIVGWNTGENSFGATKTYLHYLSRFGKVRIITPQDTIEDHIDLNLLVLPGGMDVNPNVYGENPSYYTSNTDVLKQHFYDTQLQNYIEHRIPIFGICLGFQMLNVKFGGKLIQHIPNHSYAERGEEHHKVKLIANYENLPEFYDFIQGKPVCSKKGEISVNSHHHQGVLMNQIGESLIPIITDETGMICEGFVSNNAKIAGIQCHPEEYHVSLANEMINYLLSE